MVRKFCFRTRRNRFNVLRRSRADLYAILTYPKCLSRNFPRNERNSTNATFQFDYTTWVDKIIGDLIFHPRHHGSEPSERVSFWIHLHSNEKLLLLFDYPHMWVASNYILRTSLLIYKCYRSISSPHAELECVPHDFIIPSSLWP